MTKRKSVTIDAATHRAIARLRVGESETVTIQAWIDRALAAAVREAERKRVARARV